MKRLSFALVALLLAAPLSAQTPPQPNAAQAGNQGGAANQAQVRLVVVDQTGAGIPSAAVIVTPVGGAPVTATSDERGLVTLPSLPVGAVQLHVEFPGFEPFDEPLTLRRGAMNQTVTLKITGFEEQVVVQDTASVDDARGNSLTTTLDQDVIDQLPDDPEELADMLTQMTGGAGATFQVNGFRGGTLPSRDEIRQIRFRTNSFSADNHDAGRVQVEIITKPNVRTWSGNVNTGLRNDSLNARNAFAEEKTPEQFRRFNTGIRGPIVPGRTSLRLNVDGNRSYDAGVIFAKNPDGTDFRSQVQRPYEQTNYTVGIEHALTDKQTLRIEYSDRNDMRHNQGVGDFVLPSRATERQSSGQQLRFQVQGLIGKTTLNEVRLQVNRSNTTATSLTQGLTINVNDAFYTGGAGVNSNGTNNTFDLSDDLDFAMGRKHAMRVGFRLEGGNYENYDAQNQLGTFTFVNLDAYLAGTPRTFTQRQGEVTTSFSQYQLGVYWQDDIRVNKTFSYSVGVRNELQSHLDGKFNLMPRLGFTLTPNPAWTVRGGYGIFRDWYTTSLYDQTQRLNGVAQSDIIIQNPCFPDPFACGAAASPVLGGGRVVAGNDLKMPYEHQASIGIEHPLTANISMQASYQMLRGRNQFRATNINAPDANGVRPQPTISTITQFNSTGKSQSDRLQLSANFRVPNRQMFFNANYTLGTVKNYSDSALQLPANSLDPNAEWGPSSQDVRHRFNALANLPLPANVRVNVQLQAQSASPYTITSGFDANGDAVFNDRPAGVGRNTARGEARYDMSMRISKAITFGPSRTPAGGQGGGQRGGGQGAGGGQRGGRQGGGGGQVANAQQQRPGGGGGGGRQGGGPGGGPQGGGGRFSMEFYAQGYNVLNRVNYLNFSGNQQSPFFGLPTSAAQARRVEVGLQFRF